MKKYIALLLAIVLCLTVLAGCASQQTPDVSEPEDTTPEQTTTQTETPAVDETAETQDVELWYYWETESHQITLQAAIDAYNASQTAYKVTAKYVPFADFKKQLSIGAVAETLPDMVILDSPDHASYASMGIFADLTGKIDVSGYFEGPVNSCTYDGKLYGVPFGVNCLAMFLQQGHAGGGRSRGSYDLERTQGCCCEDLRRFALRLCILQPAERRRHVQLYAVGLVGKV